ncbi:hypothetical protein BCON_0356g00040 [Botryotinia convoluta]|uniref:Uncharacterized protein n=1 Tax=Botryotinia convoluta TaxID=54673 RepID=A0A4Z1HAS5_9HELO|nr:hypothetical protein BCON_0356g00040 [Botryotinia convoluta]
MSIMINRQVSRKGGEFDPVNRRQVVARFFDNANNVRNTDRERNKRLKPTTGEKETLSPKNLRYMRQSTGVSNPWHGVTMSPCFEAQ